MATVRRILERAASAEAVFTFGSPNGSTYLIGLGQSGAGGDRSLLAFLEIDDLDFSAAFPLELLIHEGNLFMLPLTYRLPLSSPGMSRKTFRRVRKFEAAWNEQVSALFGSAAQIP